MKIAAETPVLLVTKEFSILPYAVAVLFIAIPLAHLAQPSLLKEVPPLWGDIAFMLCSVAALVLYSPKRATFDKTRGNMVLQSTSLLGSRKLKECLLSDISAVWLMTGSTQMSRGTGRNYTVVLLTKSEKIVVARSTTQGGALTSFNEPEVAGKIAAFLGVPLKEFGGLPTAEEILSAIKEGVKEGVSETMEKSKQGRI